jgi:hypothetical protein
MPSQKELFRRNIRVLSEDEIEALGVKYLGNYYYYYPDVVKKLIKAIERKLRGLDDKK